LNIAPGELDGRTILRFAHAYETGGGTERYLDDLDNSLLQRHALTIYRLHLTKRIPTPAREVRIVGRGRLIVVPLPILPGTHSAPTDHALSPKAHAKKAFRDLVLYNPIVWRLVGAKWTARRRLKPEPGQAIGAGETAEGIMQETPVDLVMLHFFGGADAEEIIDVARQRTVPVALLNHFANDRYTHLAIRKHVMSAQAVAGVNGLDVPRYAQAKFTNLSDGVDTEFFQAAKAQSLNNRPAQPIILLPARVIREKGQLDLVRAAAEVRRTGVDCCVAFAGRVDSSGFVDELKAEILRHDMTDRAHFLGVLGLEELRDWYAASTVVALPTYHHEGLPRVILEAQAMSRPVLAYTMGGVADGIQDTKTGYLFAPGDLSGLAARLRDLLTSPALASAMGSNGRAVAEKQFSLDRLAERHGQFYRGVIGGDIESGLNSS
jgi:glycosyltransferase involved in cell wall biosynthesis